MILNPGGAQKAPEITVSSGGLITATAGNKKTTKQLTTQASKTVTPWTSQQTAVSGQVYTTGPVYVAGDSNLVAKNILSDIYIFGVCGSAKAVANVVSFFPDDTYTGRFSLALDKPITNIEAVYFVAAYSKTDDTIIPPSDFYENEESIHTQELLYTPYIRYAIRADTPHETYEGSIGTAAIMNMTQDSPAILRFTLTENNFLEGADWGLGKAKYHGFAVGSGSVQNSYCLENIAGNYGNYVLYTNGSNTYCSRYNAYYMIARLRFNFMYAGTVTVTFNCTDGVNAEYVEIGNLNQALGDNRYAGQASEYQYQKSFTGSLTDSVTLSVPAGESFVDIKHCTNSSSYRIKSDTQFTVTL